MAKPTTEEFQEIKTLAAAYLAASQKGLAQMREDIRAAADFLRSEGYSRYANNLLNVEQSLSEPGSYRRLP